MQKLIRKTLPISVITEVEAKDFFSKATKVVECNLKSIPVNTERTMYIKISTVNPDRSGDVVEPNGAELKNYVNNNVVAAFHKYDRPSIGRTISFAIGEKEIVVLMEFAAKGVNPEADMLHDLYKGGMMHAASIGFRSKNYEPIPGGGNHFKTWELYEWSLVLVPDNPEALDMVKTAGLDPEQILKDQEAAITLKTEDIPDKVDETKEVHSLTVKELQDALREVDEKKDVREVVALAYVASDIDWYIRYFTEKGVSESTIEKLTQALVLIMEAIKEQAVVDVEKSLTVKAGRTISKKNESLLKTAAESINSVLSSLAEQEEEKDTEEVVEKTTPTANQSEERLIRVLIKADQVIGQGLRDAKTSKQPAANKGEEARVLPIVIGEKGGEN